MAGRPPECRCAELDCDCSWTGDAADERLELAGETGAGGAAAAGVVGLLPLSMLPTAPLNICDSIPFHVLAAGALDAGVAGAEAAVAAAGDACAAAAAAPPALFGDAVPRCARELGEDMAVTRLRWSAGRSDRSAGEGEGQRSSLVVRSASLGCFVAASSPSAGARCNALAAGNPHAVGVASHSRPDRPAALRCAGHGSARRAALDQPCEPSARSHTQPRTAKANANEHMHNTESNAAQRSTATRTLRLTRLAKTKKKKQLHSAHREAFAFDQFRSLVHRIS